MVTATDLTGSTDEPDHSVAPPRNPHEFPQLVRCFGPALQRFMVAYEQDPQIREDLRQDVLLALWRAIPNFRGDASLRTFVFRVAHNVALRHGRDEARAKRRRKVVSEQDPTTDPVRIDPETSATHRETLGQVQAYLLGLPAADRQLLFLYLEGLPGAEIAEVSGLSPTNVTTRLARLRSRLAASIQPGGAS